MRIQFLSVNTLFAPILLFFLGSIFMQIKLSYIQEERNKSSVDIAELETQVKRKQVENITMTMALETARLVVPVKYQRFSVVHNILSFLAQ